jgi:tellurite resistance protein
MASPYSRSEAAPTDNRHRDRQVMEALVTAGAAVALADGRVDVLEREALLDYIACQELVPTISRAEIAEAFERCVRQLNDRGRAQLMVEAFRPLAGLSLASVVVRTGDRVAAADRRIHPAEVRALELIRLILTTLPTRKLS